MIVVATAFLLALGLALLLTPVVRQIARRAGSVEAPESFRKIHSNSVPRVGGIAIVVAFYLPLLGIFMTQGTSILAGVDPAMVLSLMLCGVPIVLLGVYDDLIGAGAIEKLAIQIAVAVMLFSAGFRVEVISLPFDSVWHLGIYSFPLTLIWIVGLINALNLIDGLDGLASGVALCAAATIFAIAFAHGNVPMMLFIAALTGAILGFLVFNFNPATIFMGDTGSLFLGYIVAVTSLQTSTSDTATVALLTPILALALPIVDTALAFGRRFVRGQHPFQGDREHIHHKLLDMGLSHRSAVLFLYVISATLALFALAVTVTDGAVSAAISGVAVVTIFLFIKRIGGFDFDRRQIARSRERNLLLRQSQRKFSKSAVDAKCFETVWVALVDAASDLDAAQLELIPVPGSPGRQWKKENASTATLVVQRTIPATNGELRIAWDDGRTLLEAEDGGALDLLMTTMDRRVMPRVVSSGLVAAAQEG